LPPGLLCGPFPEDGGSVLRRRGGASHVELWMGLWL
jgi:hypothetical protein